MAGKSRLIPGPSPSSFEDWLNLAIYTWRRSRPLFDPSRFLSSADSARLDRPLFLLGTHGGGLTLLSRMLRRNQAVLSVTGDASYWTGADEMQNVLWPILPPELSGIRHKEPPDEVFGTPRGWLYASDRLLSKYHLTEEDATEALAGRLRRIISWLVGWHGADIDSPRFTDKSQVFTVKVRFIDALLEGCGPRFLLVTRNPYAICYRSALGKAGGLDALDDSFSFEDKLELAAQHWANSMECALDDGQHVDHFEWIRFEDLLREPEKTLRHVCSFADLEYDPDMLPREHHTIPLGSRFRDRWYPLRPEVNQKYLDTMDARHIKIVDARCRDLAETFGYEPPKT